MSRLKLLSASAASLLTGTAIGKWWESESDKSGLTSSWNHEVSDFFPSSNSDLISSVAASTILYPKPPAPAYGGGDGDAQLTVQK